MAHRSFPANKIFKFIFYSVAVTAGTILAVSAMRKNKGAIKKQGQKLLKKARRTIRTSTSKLPKRQKGILKLFDREDRITNEMIVSVIKNVSERTIRRDLNELEERGFIKKVGKTKGSYYVLV